MGINFQQIRQFGPTLDDLRRQLSHFEANVAAAIQRLVAFAAQRPTPPAKASTYSAQLGEFIPVDSSGGNVTIVLPAPSPQSASRFIVLARQSAANVITVIPKSGKVNGGASSTLATTVKAYQFMCDGAAWWEVGT